MKTFIKVENDLYIHKDDIKKMKKGHEGIGYVQLENTTDYVLVSKKALQPIKKEDVLSTNKYSVVFIMK